jgi:predicted tellurium resistance membrane protein TerC
MLALSFVILIGAMLVMEGSGHHVEKGYIYFAMGFAVAVEALNLVASRKRASWHPGGP